MPRPKITRRCPRRLLSKNHNSYFETPPINVSFNVANKTELNASSKKHSTMVKRLASRNKSIGGTLQNMASVNKTGESTIGKDISSDKRIPKGNFFASELCLRLEALQRTNGLDNGKASSETKPLTSTSSQSAFNPGLGTSSTKQDMIQDDTTTSLSVELNPVPSQDVDGKISGIMQSSRQFSADRDSNNDSDVSLLSTGSGSSDIILFEPPPNATLPLKDNAQKRRSSPKTIQFRKTIKTYDKKRHNTSKSDLLYDEFVGSVQFDYAEIENHEFVIERG